MHSRGEKKHGFRKYYYARPIDDKLRELIDQGEHVIVIGKPLSGKTRSVFNALKTLKEPAVITIPTLAVDSFPADIEIPYNMKMVTREVLLVDDIGKFLIKLNFTNVLRKFVRRGTIIVGTCWETEADFVQQKLEQEAGIRIAEYLMLDKITPDVAKNVAAKAGKQMPETFDGNIGSIFLDIEEMKRRYGQLDAAGKAVLQSVKRLYQAGIYEGREIFSLNNIHKVASKFHEIDKKKLWWDEVFGKLATQGFADKKESGVHFEEAYLQYVVEGDFVGVEDFRRLVELFGDDPSALLSIEDKSYEQGLVKLEKAAYMKVAISACKQALNTWTISDNPGQYTMTQNNLGNAYRTLAEVEDKASYCRLAIDACNEALRVYTFDDFPFQYAGTQNNLGAAYQRLAEVEDRASNCRAAIEAYNEALRVSTFDDFPIQYAMTQNNLGAAYQSFAEVEDKPSNCKAAIEAFNEAFRVSTFDDFPMDYAMTQNNLGNAYWTLAQVEDKAPNCKLALSAFKAALRVHTYDDFPMDYAMTTMNVGIAYGMWATAENRFENCTKAKDALKEALRVFTELKMENPRQRVLQMMAGLASICEGDVELKS